MVLHDLRDKATVHDPGSNTTKDTSDSNTSDCPVSFQFEKLPSDKPHIPWHYLGGIDLDMCDLCREERNYNILLPMYKERVDADFDILYCTKHGPIFDGHELKKRSKV